MTSIWLISAMILSAAAAQQAPEPVVEIAPDVAVRVAIAPVARVNIRLPIVAIAAKAVGIAEPEVYVFQGGSYLGIGVAEIDADRAKELKLPEPRGVEVTRVDQDSPAAKAGLKDGDVVLEYNAERVEGTEQFIRLVHETPPGRAVKLLISRGGAQQTLTATLGKRGGGFGYGSYDFTHDPKWQADMHKFQEDMQKWQRDFQSQMGRMRIQPPEPPQVFMVTGGRWLGVATEPLTPQLAEFFGVKKGVLVRSVIKDSPAEKAGFKAGDVIVKVDNEEIASPSDVTSRLHGLTDEKKTFPVVVVRNKQEMTLNVTVEGREPGTPEGIRPPRPPRPPQPPARFRTRSIATPDALM